MRRQSGIAMIEYLVVAGAMALALLMPIPGRHGKTAAELLIDDIAQNYHAYAWAMSIPM